MMTTTSKTAKSVAEAVPTTADVNDGGIRRRMPEGLRRHIVTVSGGKPYLPAAFRLVWFREECPDWGISTELVEGGQAAGFATVRAVIFNEEGRVIASGMKTETKQDFPAGWVEKAETGAISRALAVAGFGTQFSPELEESSSESPRSDAAPVKLGEVWNGPGQCPRCHAPEGKRHGKPCSG